VLLRLACLGAANAFALLRLLAVSDRDKNAGILALRHQIAVLERQPGKTRPWFTPGGRAFLAAPLHRLPQDVPGRFRLLVCPETVLRWHRDLLARQAASTARSAQSGPRAGDLTPQHRDLMAEDQDPGVHGVASRHQHQPAEHSEHQHADETDQHKQRA
jgi:hypothetical protein